MPHPMPKRKPDRSISRFAPVLTPRKNNNRVILDTLAKYLAAMENHDPIGVNLRRFLRQANNLLRSSPRTTSLHFRIEGMRTLFWAHEHATATGGIACCVYVPTSTMFYSCRKDLV
jgi:hypothetical protein